MTDGPNPNRRPFLSCGAATGDRGINVDHRLGRVRLKSPWPAFGGKSRVADLIWARLGDVSNYIEPFANSAAVLLARPHEPKIETLNDMDCYISNAWRAMKHDPEGVAEFADEPVNECDLHARHRWLVLSEAASEFRTRMRTDPDYFDAKVAGWWIWGSCCWIGSGWCSDVPAMASPTCRSRPSLNGAGDGVHGMAGQKHPKLSGDSPDSGALGTGVHAGGPRLSQQVPNLADWAGGRGVNSGLSSNHRPQLADAYARGRGVHGNDSAGTCAARRAWLLDWFGRLRDRLRTVRVCCGDWRRVCDSPSVTTRLGLTGIFLDPPYSKTRTDGQANRAADLYANDRAQDVDKLVADVRAYCLERGADSLMRIVLAGYAGEGHEVLESHGWSVVEWKSSGGYANRNRDNANAARERLWFSPACIDPEDAALPLFPAKDAP